MDQAEPMRTVFVDYRIRLRLTVDGRAIWMTACTTAWGTRSFAMPIVDVVIIDNEAFDLHGSPPHFNRVGRLCKCALLHVNAKCSRWIAKAILAYEAPKDLRMLWSVFPFVEGRCNFS